MSEPTDRSAPVLHRRHEGGPTLEGATLVVALEGWIDAGLSAAAAAATLRERLGLVRVATFDDDVLIDYRARRPIVHLQDGVTSSLDWAELTLEAGYDDDGHGVLLLVGPEPDTRWRPFVHEVLELAAEHGTHTICTLGAYPMPVPHTRPPRLAATSPDPSLVDRLSLERGTVDLPAGMATVLELAAHAKGWSAFGLWAQVPHYASSMAYPAASVALLEGLAAKAGLRCSVEGLADVVAATRVRISELVAANGEHLALLRQLEEQYDATQPGLDAEALPSVDELAAEVEQFLRDRPE